MNRPVEFSRRPATTATCRPPSLPPGACAFLLRVFVNTGCASTFLFLGVLVYGHVSTTEGWRERKGERGPSFFQRETKLRGNWPVHSGSPFFRATVSKLSFPIAGSEEQCGKKHFLFFFPFFLGEDGEGKEKEAIANSFFPNQFQLSWTHGERISIWPFHRRRKIRVPASFFSTCSRIEKHDRNNIPLLSLSRS